MIPALIDGWKAGESINMLMKLIKVDISWEISGFTWPTFQAGDRLGR